MEAAWVRAGRTADTGTTAGLTTLRLLSAKLRRGRVVSSYRAGKNVNVLELTVLVLLASPQGEDDRVNPICSHPHRRRLSQMTAFKSSPRNRGFTVFLTGMPA